MPYIYVIRLTIVINDSHFGDRGRSIRLLWNNKISGKESHHKYFIAFRIIVILNFDLSTSLSLISLEYDISQTRSKVSNTCTLIDTD